MLSDRNTHQHTHTHTAKKWVYANFARDENSLCARARVKLVHSKFSLPTLMLALRCNGCPKISAQASCMKSNPIEALVVLNTFSVAQWGGASCVEWRNFAHGRQYMVDICAHKDEIFADNWAQWRRPSWYRCHAAIVNVQSRFVLLAPERISSAQGKLHSYGDALCSVLERDVGLHLRLTAQKNLNYSNFSTRYLIVPSKLWSGLYCAHLMNHRAQTHKFADNDDHTRRQRCLRAKMVMVFSTIRSCISVIKQCDVYIMVVLADSAGKDWAIFGGPI